MPQSSKLAGSRRNITQPSSNSSQPSSNSSHSILAALSSTVSSVDRLEDVRNPGQPQNVNAPRGSQVEAQPLPLRSKHDPNATHRLGSVASQKTGTHANPVKSYASTRTIISKLNTPVEVSRELEREPTFSDTISSTLDGNDHQVKPDLQQQEHSDSTSMYRTHHSKKSPLQASQFIESVPYDNMEYRKRQGIALQRNPAIGRYSAGPPGLTSDDVFCSLDILESAFDASPDIAILRGRLGTLDVYQISSGSLQLAGSVSGFDGIITRAKMIPTLSSNDPFKDKRPLVVVSRLETAAQPASLEPGSTSLLDIVSTLQVHVEVRSIQSSECLQTLFSSEITEIGDDDYVLGNDISRFTRLDFELDVKSNFIMITSPHSGEILLYCALADSNDTSARYQCVGKFWTAIHIGQPDEEPNANESESPSRSQQPRSHSARLTPLCALSARWLTVVSPNPTQKSVLSGASVPCGFAGGKQELRSPVPVASPAPNCFTELGEEDSFMNKMARGVAQEVLRGARWVGSQGWQVWNSYWSGDSARNGLQRPHSPPQLTALSARIPSTASVTGGNEVAIISIYDIKALTKLEKPKSLASSHVATFETFAGCSFLSFSPTGLQLLVANKKGDEQRILDLSGIYPTPISFIQQIVKSSRQITRKTSPQFVRQVSKFSRYTDAETVDIEWSLPAGDRLALTTKHGTLHVFSLRCQGYAKPPFSTQPQYQTHETSLVPSRRNMSDNSHHDDMTGELSRKHGSSWSDAVQSFGDATSPLISAAASRARSFSNGSKGAAHSFPTPITILSGGGKAISTGLSRSLEAASESVNYLRHSGNNKLRLNVASDGIKTDRVKWLTRQGGYIAIVSSESIRIHQVRESRVGTTLEKRLSIIREATHHHSLLGLDRDRNRKMLGSTMIRPSSSPYALGATETHRQHSGTLHPLASVEIDTHQSLRPFQQCRRHRIFTTACHVTDPSMARHNGAHINIDCSLGTLSSFNTTRIRSHGNRLQPGSKPTRIINRPEGAQKRLENSYEILSHEP